MSIKSTDSFSRYDNSNQLFHIGKPSSIKAEVFNAPSMQKDTLEISREKIQEDALKCLKQPSKYLVAQPGFMRIGKYIFKAVVFPPYFLLYGLPKWFLADAVPTVFSYLYAKVAHVHSLVKKPFQFIQRQLETWRIALTHSLIKLFLPIQRLLIDFQQLVSRLYQSTLDPFHSLIKQINQRIQLWKEKIKDKNFSYVTNQLKRGLENVQEKMQFYFQKLTHVSSHLLFVIKDKPQHIWKRVKNKSRQWKEKGANQYRSSQQLAEQATKKVIQFFQKQKENLKEKFSFVSSLRLFFSTTFAKIASYRQQWQQNFQHFFQKHYRRLLLNFDKTREKIQKINLTKLVESFYQQAFFLSLPSKTQVALKRFFSNPSVLVSLHKLLKAYQVMSLSSLSGSRFLLKQSAKLTDKFSSAYQAAKHWCSSIKAHTLLGFTKISARLAKWLERTLYYLLLIFMIIKISLKWGVVGLSDTMNDIKHYFNRSKVSNTMNLD